MGLKVSPENEARALRFAIAFAAERWPNANRVTMPQLVAEIEADKARLRKLERQISRTDSTAKSS